MSRDKSNRIHRGAQRSSAAQGITYLVPCGSAPFDQSDEGPGPLSVGGADEGLARDAHKWWIEAAQRANIDLTGFNPVAPLAERIAWAIELGLEIAAVLSRFSTKLQDSTAAQVQFNVEFAASHGLYTPPEFISVDEAEKGRRVRRDGLDRTKFILKNRWAQTLLVFKISRLLRVGYKGFEFVNEEVVEEGLRAISTSQGIDTRDEKTWKSLMYFHGFMDELLLDTIADHVRAGLKNLFQQGFSIGALTVGYRGIEIPGAPRTKRGLPRTRPEVDPDVAKLIKQHFEWIRDGMSIRAGWRRWMQDGGPFDPRSTLGRMSYIAYRRMLSNPRYLGVWAFGRKKNRWSSKRDYNRPVDQPDSEVAIYQCEDLRILDDELFRAVQVRLADFKLGPRGPHKQKKEIHLWDLTTELFYCAACNVRFYQTGAHGKGMQCKRSDLCPCKSAVLRQEAVRAICTKLIELIQRDADLVRQIFSRSKEIDAHDDQHLETEIVATKSKLQVLTNRINELEELAGQGDVEDRRRRVARINAAGAERAGMQLELTRLQKSPSGAATAITPEEADQILREFNVLLEDAANGKLGPDVVYKAFAIFRALTGGRIMVHVERRQGRKRTNVRGVFRPHLLQAVKAEAKVNDIADNSLPEPVEVWLREPPRLDLLADPVHQLIDIDGLGLGGAAAKLCEEGWKVNSVNVWYSYRRWYQMQGLTVPKRPYNNGRPRKPC